MTYVIKTVDQRFVITSETRTDDGPIAWVVHLHLSGNGLRCIRDAMCGDEREIVFQATRDTIT